MLRTVLAAAAIILTLATPPALAATQSDSYATPGGVGGVIAASCTQCFTAAGVTINVGGANFAATGALWMAVTIADASGGPVSFSVGQDYDDDGLTDVQFDFCSTTTDISGLGFSPYYDLIVFVDATGVDCNNVATSGTITVTTT